MPPDSHTDLNAGSLYADVSTFTPKHNTPGLSVTGDYVERRWMSEVHDGIDSHRNSVIIAHRRAGKTVGIVAQLLRIAFSCKLRRPQVAYIAPTAKQARDVSWFYFVDMLADIPGCRFNKHELSITLPNGGRVLFASGDNYDRLRGLYLDGACVDEAADCPEALIPMVLRPALADRKGKLILIGTVRGRNYFWDQYADAIESPDWYAAKFLPDDTGAIDAEELAFLKRNTSDEAWRQEMLCDPTAASRGAFWAQTLADHAEQQTSVPYDQNIGVCVAFDLGIADSTAVWFAQLAPGGEIRLIEYLEYQNTGFLDILSEIKRKPYEITRWIGPHDLKVRDYTTGQARIDAAASVGVHFEIAPKLLVIDGIEAVRRALPRCWFDAIQCRQGLVSLQQYHSDYDEKRRVLSRQPVHDWSSHAADSFRYLITGTDGGSGQTSLQLPPLEYGNISKLTSKRAHRGYRRGQSAAS